MAADTAGALGGVRVIELAAGLPAAYAGKLLAQCGAEVIRVEPPGGDPVRAAGPFPGDEPDPDAGARHVFLNGGKRSVALDVESEQGAAAAAGLIAGADALVTSWRTPSALPLGDFAAMRERFPDTLYVSISPFGRTGPYADYEGDSHVLEALAGFTYVTGYPDREPVGLGVDTAEHLGGLYGWVTTLTLLNARAAGERPRAADISCYEAAALTDDHNLAVYEGMGLLRRRFYSRVLGAYPSDIMRCRDGFVSVVPGAPDFATSLALLIDRPDLIDDPLLQLPKERVVRWRDFDALISPWLMEHDAEEIVTRAQELRLAFAFVPDVADLAADEHLAARGFFEEAGGGPAVGPPVRLSETPLRPAPPPRLGEANAELAGGAP